MGRDFKLRPTVNGANVLVAGDTVTADTELPTPAALADATSNPTVPAVGAALLGFNGTTWDRVRTANTGRLQVDVVTGGGGGTQYAEDAALGSSATGTLTLGRRDDVLSPLSEAQGDAVGLRISGVGSLWTSLFDPSSEYQANINQAISDNQANVAGLITNSYLVGFNGTGWDRVRVANTGRLQVDVVTGGGGGTQYAEDSVLSSTSTGTLVLARRDDSLSALTPAQDDAVGLRVNSRGALWVVNDGGTLDQNLNPVFENSSGAYTATASNGDGNSGNNVKLPTSAWLMVYNGSTWDRGRGNTNGLFVGGSVASGSTDAGNPVKVGGRYNSTVPTFTDGQRGDLQLTASGALRTTLYAAGSSDTPVSVNNANSDTVSVNNNYLFTAGMLHGFNGTNWDRIRTANTGRLQVDVVTGGGGGTQYVEDVAFGGNGTGTLMLARRDDSLSTLTPVEDDAVGLRVSARGALWASLDIIRSSTNAATIGHIVGDTGYLGDGIGIAGGSADALATGSLLLGYNGSSWDRVRVANTGRLQVDVITAPSAASAGDVANDAVDSGNPVKVGGKAQSGLPTAVASADRVNALFDIYGRQAVMATTVLGGADGITNTSLVSIPAQGDTTANVYRLLHTAGMVFNGTTWDRPRTVTTGDAVGVTGVPAAGLLGYNGSGGWDRVRVANTGRLQVDVVTAPSAATAGDVAHDAVDSGNPVKIGGVGRDSAPTAVADADRVNAWFSRSGAMHVALGDDGSLPTVGQNAADGVAFGTANGLLVTNRQVLYNGSTFDRARSTDAFVTASATPTAGIVASLAPDRRYTSVSLGTAANSTQSWDVMGADVVMVHVGTSTTGTFIFEVSADGSNWQSAEVRDTATDLWVSNTNLTPTANKVYRIITNGWRLARARTVTTLGATVALTATLAQHSTVLNAIDSGPAPHNIGYTITSETAQYTTAQTGTAFWTPTSGKKLVITSYQIQVGGTTSGTMQLWFGASGDTTYTRGTDLAIFDGEFAPSATSKPGVVQTGTWVASAVDHILRVTDSAAINPLTVTVWGYEV